MTELRELGPHLAIELVARDPAMTDQHLWLVGAVVAAFGKADAVLTGLDKRQGLVRSGGSCRRHGVFRFRVSENSWARSVARRSKAAGPKR